MLSKGARNIEIYRAYKFRLYPKLMNKKILIYKTFGCKRFVYNYYLNYLNSFYNIILSILANIF